MTFECLLFRDVCVQFLLDNLIKIAVRVEGSLTVIQTHLMDAYKVCTTHETMWILQPEVRHCNFMCPFANWVGVPCTNQQPNSNQLTWHNINPTCLALFLDCHDSFNYDKVLLFERVENCNMQRFQALPVRVFSMTLVKFQYAAELLYCVNCLIGLPRCFQLSWLHFPHSKTNILSWPVHFF